MDHELSKTLEQVRALVARGEVHVSLHGYEELAADVAKEADMSGRSTKRLVREGEFVAEVDVHLVEAEGAGHHTCPWRTRTSSTTCGMRSGRATSSEPLNSPTAFTVSRR